MRRTRRAYVLPATHYASRYTDLDLPRMGERFRLRKDFDTTGFPPHARAILEGLKKYGMFVADNGQDWLLSISPDARLKGLETLERVKGSDFEVVDTGARWVEARNRSRGFSHPSGEATVRVTALRARTRSHEPCESGNWEMDHRLWIAGGGCGRLRNWCWCRN